MSLISPAQGETGLNETVRAALQGNEFAFQHLLGAISPIIHGICQGIIGRDHPDLDDITQDCYLEIVLALPRFRFEADLTHYVSRIVKRRAIGARKRTKAQYQFEAVAASHAMIDGNFIDPGDPYPALVHKLFRKVGSDQATALCMRLLLGYSTDEIARITGVPVNTVKSRLRLGKHRIRNHLVKRGEAPRSRT